MSSGSSSNSGSSTTTKSTKSSPASAGILIGCVGKPSSGKSTFLNAATGANAKMGDYPFTTIEPNIAVCWYQIDCPCIEHGLENKCNPRYGTCKNGKRTVPIQMMDVAGLVPGASIGKGMGNTFLDDLRHAAVFLHVLDASGCTDAEGKKTIGYDPVSDVDWLFDEIHAWIFNNLWNRWSSIIRRHVAAHCEIEDTLTRQLSGYGAKLSHIQRTISMSNMKDIVIRPLQDWDEEDLRVFVKCFCDVRFPTVLVLNKSDQPDSARNIEKICRKYPHSRTVPCSALAEVFLRKMAKKRVIRYSPGDDDYELTHNVSGEGGADGDADEIKANNRLKHIRDMVLFRYGGTGVMDSITSAVESLGYLPVFPVRSLANFTDGKGSVFKECILMPPGSKVSDLVSKFGGNSASNNINSSGGSVNQNQNAVSVVIEAADGRRLSEDELLHENGHRVVRVAYVSM